MKIRRTVLAEDEDPSVLLREGEYVASIQMSATKAGLFFDVFIVEDVPDPGGGAR